MGIVCQRCNTNKFLMKQYLDDGYLKIICTVDGWCTGKLDRHAYENFTDQIKTESEMHKDMDKWK